MYLKTYRHISTIPTTPGSLLSSSTDPALPCFPHTPLGEGQEHGDLNVNSYNNMYVATLTIILLWNALYRSLIDN